MQSVDVQSRLVRRQTDLLRPLLQRKHQNPLKSSSSAAVSWGGGRCTYEEMTQANKNSDDERSYKKHSDTKVQFSLRLLNEASVFYLSNTAAI